MKLLPAFQPGDLTVIVSLTVTIIGYLIYWYISMSQIVLKKLRDVSGNDAVQLRKILWQRIIGILFLGIIPGFIILTFLPYSLTDLGVHFQAAGNTIPWILGIGVIVVCLSYLSRKSPENLKNYPQIRVQDWNVRLFILNAISWAGFLMAYEFLFRGILLFTLFDIWGTWPAVAINTFIYALVHFPKGPRETIGAMPLGLILCLVTLHTGNIWTAFLVHLFMALSNDYFSVKTHPDFQFVK